MMEFLLLDPVVPMYLADQAYDSSDSGDLEMLGVGVLDPTTLSCDC